MAAPAAIPLTGGAIMGANAALAGVPAATGALSLTGVLAGGLSILSAGMQIMQGLEMKSMLDTEAEYEEFRADQIRVRGIEEQADILEQTNADLAANTLTLATTGLQYGGVTRSLTETRKRQFDMARNAARFDESARRASARALRRRGSSSLIGGFGSAAGTLGTSLLLASRRG